MLYTVFYFVIGVFIVCIVASIWNGIVYLWDGVSSNKENFFIFLFISMCPFLLVCIIGSIISTSVKIYSQTEKIVVSLNMKIEELQVMNKNQTTNTLISHTVNLVEEYNNYYKEIVENIEEYSNAKDKNFIQDNFNLITYDYITNQAIFDNGSLLVQVEYVPLN